MSFILNALRKSEQERQTLHAETVTDRIVINQLQPNKSKSVKFYAALIIGNVLLVSAIFALQGYDLLFFFKKEQQATAIIPLAPKEILKPTFAREKSIQATVPEQASIAEWINHQEPVVKALAAQPTIKKITTLEPVEMADQHNKTKVPSENNLAIVNANNPDTNSYAGMPVKTKIPFLSDLPGEFRRTIPGININVFVYSEHGEESFVMIDMVKYKAGQQLKNGMLLKAILNDSLLIVYQNREFQIERP